MEVDVRLPKNFWTAKLFGLVKSLVVYTANMVLHQRRQGLGEVRYQVSRFVATVWSVNSYSNRRISED